jgi:Uma2 family endonuclease
MSAVPRTTLTVEQYLAIEQKAEFKSEFFQGEMFAMAGAAPLHNFILENLSVEIGSRLRKGPCRTVSSDQRVSVEATGLYTYPDLLIVCGEPQFDSVDRNSITNPVAIIEVLSPSTEKYDRGPKFRNYQQIPSLKDYVLVSQEEPNIERFFRLADGGWGYVAFAGLEAILTLTSVPVQIPLADIYAGITFEEAAS